MCVKHSFGILSPDQKDIMQNTLNQLLYRTLSLAVISYYPVVYQTQKGVWKSACVRRRILT